MNITKVPSGNFLPELVLEPVVKMKKVQGKEKWRPRHRGYLFFHSRRVKVTVVGKQNKKIHSAY